MFNKAILFDRDDTLIADPGYINHPDQVTLLDGVAKALIDLKSLRYKLVIVSNQSAVARGIVTEKVLDEIHDRLKQLLAEKGAYIDQIYYCPYHPDGVIAKYRKESELRKPNPGMLLTAAKEMNIDLSQSWMIGDSSRDVEAGLSAGCKTILINGSSTIKKTDSLEAKPDYKAVNIKEAVNIIKKYHRSSDQSLKQTQSVSPEKAVVSQAEPAEPQTIREVADSVKDKTEHILSNILDQLKSMHRSNMFSEFSTMRLMAIIVQVIALFCLLASVWFLMSPTRQDNSVFIALGFAIVLQLMALTFYTMQGRK